MAKSTASGSGVGTSLPAGMIMPFAGEVIPAGWELCDGRAVSRTAFRDLFNVIGESFGNGDGSSTFHLPDLRGRFLRGHDPTALVDVDAGTRFANNAGGATGNNLGTEQVDQYKSHTHSKTVYWDSAIGPFNAGYINSYSAAQNPHVVNMDASGGSETRPKNVAINYIIKV
jgi:microcystin-dependent protein